MMRIWKGQLHIPAFIVWNREGGVAERHCEVCANTDMRRAYCGIGFTIYYLWKQVRYDSGEETIVMCCDVETHYQIETTILEFMARWYFREVFCLNQCHWFTNSGFIGGVYLFLVHKLRLPQDSLTNRISVYLKQILQVKPRAATFAESETKRNTEFSSFSILEAFNKSRNNNYCGEYWNAENCR